MIFEICRNIDDYSEVAVTNTSDDAGKSAEKKVSDVHAEAYSNKFDQAISADEIQEEQLSILQKGLFSFEISNWINFLFFVLKYEILFQSYYFVATPVGPSKYSKFDSDPEDEQEEKGKTKLPGTKDKAEMVVDSTSGISVSV